jgi:hypothetical protein
MPPANARTLHLHVGAPKSGTTYLQSRLQRNAASLREHGVWLPRTPDEGPRALMFRAALDLTGVYLGRGRAYADGAWDLLVQRIADTPHPRVVVSHEAFARADAAAVARAHADAERAGHDLHVVFTTRDLGRSLVSAWVEGVKHGSPEALAAFLDRAREGALPVLATLDPVAVLSAWGANLPANRVHLVTVPPGDPAALWPRFCDAVGVHESWTPHPAVVDNPTVGAAETEVLLSMNRALGAQVARGGPLHRVVQQQVVPLLRGSTSSRVVLPTEHRAWAESVSRGWVDALGSADVTVHGNLADLVP